MLPVNEKMLLGSASDVHPEPATQASTALIYWI